MARDAAQSMIGQFGETVTVTEMGDGEFEDSTDPIYHSSTQTTVSTSTHDVRLYTTPSKETLQDYGFDEETDSMMYSTDSIAEQGDKVEYAEGSYNWVVGNVQTNQIGNGPYIYVYQLLTE